MFCSATHALAVPTPVITDVMTHIMLPSTGLQVAANRAAAAVTVAQAAAVTDITIADITATQTAAAVTAVIVAIKIFICEMRGAKAPL